MDCKITVNYFKERARMCKNKCVNCPLSSYNNGRCLVCDQLAKEYPNEAIAIVQKWSDEHPLPKPKTYADDFFEKFPNAPKESDGVPKCCRNNVYGGGRNDFCSGSLCYKCWNEVMEVTE